MYNTVSTEIISVYPLPVRLSTRQFWQEIHQAENKMVSKQMSMAEELLNTVTPEPFTKILCLLHDTRMISIDTFKEKQKELMKHHWI